MSDKFHAASCARAPHRHNRFYGWAQLKSFGNARQQVSDGGQLIKKAMELRLRGPAGEIERGKIEEDKSRFEIRQGLMAYSITEENRQDGENNAEAC